MKKIIYLLLAVGLCCGMWSCGDDGLLEGGSDGTDSDYETGDSHKYVDNFEKYSITDLFPDPIFRAYVLQEIDYNHDGRLSEHEVFAVTEIDVSGREIEDLHGVGYFTSLQKLYCGNNKLKKLFLSKNTKLILLHCYDNQLISLDISGCSNLQDVLWNNNPFEYINFGDANPTQYYSTSTKYNELGSSTKLKVVGNKIMQLDVNGNKLQSLDVSECPALERLECYNNQLTSLDVSKNTALTTLACHSNPLGSLDVSKNTALTGLSCSYNQLTNLDVSKNTALTTLNCFANQLTDLDVSQNTALTYLQCDRNQLTSLDVSKNTALTDLRCSSNQLTDLDVSQHTALTELLCYENQLTSLNISGCTALTTLACYSNQLTSLDVSKNTALTTLACHSNQLTSLDVSKNTALTTLRCTGNPLTTIYMKQWHPIAYLSKPDSAEIVYVD